MNNNFQSNLGKNINITWKNQTWSRLPIKTHLILKDENIFGVIEKYAKPYLKTNDIIFISEKIIAISQGRAFHINDIKPSKLAKFLIKFVHRSPYGIGLGSPWTMELAIKEAGRLRILFAAFLSAITKPFGFKGVFYYVVGKNINSIDGPCNCTIPPFNEYAKLGPIKPNKVAKELSEKIKHEIIIIDANDLGVNVLGKSSNKITNKFCENIFKDNPLGQASEQTPICIVRRVN